jgi:Flp pilus assembly pilin Flp
MVKLAGIASSSTSQEWAYSPGEWHPASALMEEACRNFAEEPIMMMTLRRFWNDEQGQDIAEYAVMLAVILVIVIGTVRLIGSNATTVFSEVASSVN